ncbi:MAG TPA: zinc ribbon domain-containing protein [Fimbriimonadaceae bacterium]|jgi:putative FmdB family regulatory protein|nr:hypothetical protein CCB81_11845 [Armatimonadetes bacterium Uphvl-Ar2]MCZ8138591.1 zinc ribbon domain-containing protein [Fimbriimonadaceae bacterium]HAY14981.1 hypothetical protein [Armatimonadota bacterium]HCM74221.1 hypothetical protein [Armatimonadota bacterium]HRD30277.1 zinc ribbon domain-containing protein [Fimbriimonadaceae bacterium]
MPIYEYELIDDECPMCPSPFGVLQSVNEEALTECPFCHKPCKRVVSQVQIKMAKDASADKAAKHGLSTFRRAQSGTWEKVAGPGVDVIQGNPDDVKDEKKKVVDLDKGSS